VAVEKLDRMGEHRQHRFERFGCAFRAARDVEDE
jgi:hypothetical protein